MRIVPTLFAVLLCAGRMDSSSGPAVAEGAPVAFAYRPTLAVTALSLPPAGARWMLEAVVEPGLFDRKGEAGFVFQGADGHGVRLKVKPFGGGVLLEEILSSATAKPAKLLRNPTMNLAEGEYSFRLRFRVRLLVGDGRVQLYLGFHGLPPDFIHAEVKATLPVITKAFAYAQEGEVRFKAIELSARSEPVPDATVRPPVRDAMPSYGEFVGTHYVARDGFSLYRGLFYEPVVYRVLENPAEKPATDFRPWVGYATAENLPPECVERRGPFSGQSVWVHTGRVNQMLAWADDHGARLVHGRDVLKRTEYYPQAEVMRRKDELYWSVRALFEGRTPETSRIVLQLGNEVNGFHVPWKNHPDLVRRYVEYDFAPAAEAIRRVSEDLYGAPDRIPFLMASVSSPWPLAHGWLVAMADYRIEGDWAPSLRGLTVASLARGASIHYVLKGPFWAQALDATYQRLLVSGKTFGLWSTEEVGGNADLDRGPYVAAIPFRYLDWWSRRDWQPGRGAVIYWGDTRGKTGYTSAVDVQTMLGSFLESRPLRNETDRVVSAGSPDREIYAFATRDASRPRIVFAALSNQYWFFPDNQATGELQLTQLALRCPELANRRLRVAWYRVTDHRIDPITRVPLHVGAAGEIALPQPVTLDRTKEELLLGFVADETETGLMAMNFHPAHQEPTRLRDDGEWVSFHLGNDLAVDLGGELAWTMLSDGGLPSRKSAATVRDNLDEGMAGDHHGVTLDRRNGQNASYGFVLQRAIPAGRGVALDFALQGDPVELWWDGQRLAGRISMQSPRVVLSAELAARWFECGHHVIRFQNELGKSTSVDALKVTPLTLPKS